MSDQRAWGRPSLELVRSPQFYLYASALISGPVAAWSAAVRPVAFDAWFRLFQGLALVVVLLLAIALPILRAKRKAARYQVSGDQLVRADGRAFLCWFLLHHLLWALPAGLVLFVALILFGPTAWVAVLISGMASVVVLAILALLVPTPLSGLALCWRGRSAHQTSWWDEAGRTLLARRRYREASRAHPQEMASLARTLDLAQVGGAERAPDFWNNGFASFGAEIRARLFAFAPLFAVSCLLAALVFLILPRFSPLPGYQALAGRGAMARAQLDPSVWERLLTQTDAQALADDEALIGGAQQSQQGGDQQGGAAEGSKVGEQPGGSIPRDGKNPNGDAPGGERSGDQAGSGPQPAEGAEGQSQQQNDQAQNNGAQEQGDDTQQNGDGGPDGQEGDGAGPDQDEAQGQGEGQNPGPGEGAGAQPDTGQQPGDQEGEGQGAGSQGAQVENGGESPGGMGDGAEVPDQPSNGFGSGEDTPEDGGSEGQIVAEFPPAGPDQIITVELPPLQRAAKGKPGDKRAQERPEGGAANERANPGDIRAQGKRREGAQQDKKPVQHVPNWILNLRKQKKKPSGRQP